MLEDTASAARSSWSAERSALVADALRRSGDSPRRVRLQVHGESMLPALWPGDVVEIAGCSLADLQPGEIVLALRDGRLFLHRLVQQVFDAPGRPTGFVLRGDSMPAPDPQFPSEALLGRLVDGAVQGRGVSAPVPRPGFGAKWFGAKWSRAVGMVFCHCGVARRLALKLHRRGKAPARDFENTEPGANLTSAEWGDL